MQIPGDNNKDKCQWLSREIYRWAHVLQQWKQLEAMQILQILKFYHVKNKYLDWNQKKIQSSITWHQTENSSWT